MIYSLSHQHISYWLFGLAALILAYDPVLWLAQTWRDPSYDSKGFVVFAACLALFLWSGSSHLKTAQAHTHKFSLILLALSAFIRLIGQVLAINVIGALTLVLDVYAVSRISGLQNRTRAVSPFWLAICFAFSLPLERIVQRTMGYGLQHLSADGACGLLGTFFENVQCFGVRILINAQDVLVDLPCSGARSCLLLLFFFCLCASLVKPKFTHAVLGGLGVLVCAYIINVLRISFLAVGIAYPIGFDVMAQPYHDLIGLAALSLGCLPIIFWARYCIRPKALVHPLLVSDMYGIPRRIQRDGWWLEAAPKKKNQSMRIAVSFLLLALVITNLPRKAVDVARIETVAELPSNLNGNFAQNVQLTEQEQAYFTQYGGSAQKAVYGDQALMVVRTSAPLRHLHAPDECLRGLGMNVHYQGITHNPMPSAVYKATDSNGQSYRIAVSFMTTDQEIITTNVSEAVWRWLQNPRQSWQAVQRISQWDQNPRAVQSFDYALMAALDLPFSNHPIQLAQFSKGEKP